MITCHRRHKQRHIVNNNRDTLSNTVSWWKVRKSRSAFKVVALLGQTPPPPLGPGLQEGSLVFLGRDGTHLVCNSVLQGMHILEPGPSEMLFDPAEEPEITRSQVWQIWRVREACPAKDSEQCESVSGIMCGGVVHMDEFVTMDHCSWSPPGVSGIKSPQDTLEHKGIHSEGSLHVF